MLYLILKWVHVMGAIIAVGANATYGVWLSRSARDSQHLGFTLRVIKNIDDRMANPAYGLLLVLGIAMVLTGKIPPTTPWLLAVLVLYVILLLIGVLGYTPTLRRQIATLDSAGASSPQYQALSRRGTTLGIILAVIAVAIVFFMVVKPNI